MDPHLRAEIKAFLQDLWSGTDIEIAQRKASLRIVREGEELTEADIDKIAAITVRNIRADARDSVIRVKEKYDDDPFDAVRLDQLEDILDQTIHPEGD